MLMAMMLLFFWARFIQHLQFNSKARNATL